MQFGSSEGNKESGRSKGRHHLLRRKRRYREVNAYIGNRKSYLFLVSSKCSIKGYHIHVTVLEHHFSLPCVLNSNREGHV